MKAIYMVPLLLCAYAQADNTLYQNADSGVATAFKIEGMHVNMLAKHNGLSEDDGLTAGELAAMNVVARNVLENTLRNLLESFRAVVINGNENFPVLDPLELDPLGPFVVNVAPGTNANLLIRGFHMDGLRWYVVDDVTFSPLRLTLSVHLTVPWLTFTGSYDADARIGPVVVHRAGGNYRVFFNRLEVGVDVRLGTNLLGGHLVLRELDIKFDLQDVNIRIDGMVGSSLINNFINNLVQSISQEIVQNEMENLSKILSAELFDVINDILKDYTLADILG